MLLPNAGVVYVADLQARNAGSSIITVPTSIPKSGRVYASVHRVEATSLRLLYLRSQVRRTRVYSFYSSDGYVMYLRVSDCHRVGSVVTNPGSVADLLVKDSDGAHRTRFRSVALWHVVRGGSRRLVFIHSLIFFFEKADVE